MDISVEKVAKSARLSLTTDEKKRFQKDMESIVEAFSVLDEKISCEPSFQPVPMANVMREDREEQGLTQKEALENTKHKERGYFKGPRAV